MITVLSLSHVALSLGIMRPSLVLVCLGCGLSVIAEGQRLCLVKVYDSEQIVPANLKRNH